MPKSKAPEAVFKASDGSTHPTLRAAQLHNDVIDAEAHLRVACRQLKRAIGEAILTADGVPFVDVPGGEFYIVQAYAGYVPKLLRITCWLYNAEIDRNEKGVILRWYRAGDKYEGRPVRDLYATREAAVAELHRQQTEWLLDCQKQVDDELARVLLT